MQAKIVNEILGNNLDLLKIVGSFENKISILVRSWLMDKMSPIVKNKRKQLISILSVIVNRDKVEVARARDCLEGL